MKGSLLSQSQIKTKCSGFRTFVSIWFVNVNLCFNVSINFIKCCEWMSTVTLVFFRFLTWIWKVGIQKFYEAWLLTPPQGGYSRYTWQGRGVLLELHYDSANPKKYMCLKFYAQINTWHQNFQPKKIQDLNTSILIYRTFSVIRRTGL